MVHSGAAIAHLAGMDYTGPHSLFIRVLLDKKYALPYKVVDALVFHFIRCVRFAALSVDQSTLELTPFPYPPSRRQPQARK